MVRLQVKDWILDHWSLVSGPQIFSRGVVPCFGPHYGEGKRVPQSSLRTGPAQGYSPPPIGHANIQDTARDLLTFRKRPHCDGISIVHKQNRFFFFFFLHQLSKVLLFPRLVVLSCLLVFWQRFLRTKFKNWSFLLQVLKSIPPLGIF